MLKKRLPVLLQVSCVVLAAIMFPQLTMQSASASLPGPAPTLLPDLIVDQASLRQHWVVRVEDFPAEFCSVIEGDVTPGTHTVVRFTVSTPNIGDADLVVGDPNAHMNPPDGLYEFASCHNHFHFRHYALYQ